MGYESKDMVCLEPSVIKTCLTDQKFLTIFHTEDLSSL